MFQWQEAQSIKIQWAIDLNCSQPEQLTFQMDLQILSLDIFKHFLLLFLLITFVHADRDHRQAIKSILIGTVMRGADYNLSFCKEAFSSFQPPVCS